jgi:8-oxo-dGTP pyrophosphatase MutT (NUDIX family)
MQFDEILIRISNVLENKQLPGMEAQFAMAPADRRPPADYISRVQSYKESAVMILLLNVESSTRFVLIKRAGKTGPHAGQFALPGGKIEPEDASHEAAALRETEEEIGIIESLINPIGNLTPLYIPVSNYMVHPVVGYLNQTPTFKAQSSEVEAIYLPEIKKLLEPDAKTIQQVNASYQTIRNVPCFKIDDKVIWGATAMILNELCSIITNTEY